MTCAGSTVDNGLQTHTRADTGCFNTHDISYEAGIMRRQAMGNKGRQHRRTNQVKCVKIS